MILFNQLLWKENRFFHLKNVQMEVVLVPIPKEHNVFSNFDYFLLDIFLIIAAELN